MLLLVLFLFPCCFLSKASDDNFILKNVFLELADITEQNKAPWVANMDTPYDSIQVSKASFSCSFTLSQWERFANNIWIWLFDGNNNEKASYSVPKLSPGENFETDITLSWTNIIYFKYRNYQNYYVTFQLLNFKCYEKTSIPKTTTGYLPRNVANLWENAAYTTFGRHIDGTRITHE